MRRGAIGTLAGQAARLGVQLITVVVLARLLSPEDFGVFAMVAVAVGIAEIVRDFGLGTAALQAPSLTNQQASNLLWLNAALGVITSVALIAIAPLLVLLYDEPRVLPVVPLLAVGVILNAAQVQFQVSLAREGRFSGLVITELVSQVLSAALAVGLATVGFGYWSLVLQYVAAAALTLLLRCTLSRWAPTRPRRSEGTGSLLRSGRDIGLANLLGFAASSADRLSIGAVAGPLALGYYDRAFKLQSLPTTGLLGPLTAVVLPSLGRAHEREPGTLSSLLRLQTFVGLLMAAIYASIAASAGALTDLLLGPGWETVEPILVLFCIGGAFQGLSFVNYWAYLHLQDSQGLLRSNMVTKVISSVAIVIAAFYGPRAVAATLSVTLAATWVFATFYLGRRASLPVGALLKNGAMVVACGWGGWCVGSLVSEGASPQNPLLATMVVASTVTVFITLTSLLIPLARAEYRYLLQARLGRQ